MKIKDLAKMLDVSVETVRVGLQIGVFPFGTAFKAKGSTHYTYIIYPKKVDEYIGEIQKGETT